METDKETLRIRTMWDCNATNLLLYISFIYLLKCKRNGLNNYSNGILCVCVCVCVCACVRSCVRVCVCMLKYIPFHQYCDV